MGQFKGIWNGLVITVGLTAIGCILARVIVDPYVRWLEPIIAEYGPEVALLITLVISGAALIFLLIVTHLFGRKRT
ncbi:hypothetical protein CcrColossus_gp391 [Caulobacter phage CcrColossus]|uniref:Uncharacterized protein n=1 Tax=Caulobacter phage CcrColossus TaxID=1211640 RepID=K4JSZ2_9CAUD|nr:hypothetical protein CcrColossus_gp391 [Caulobacter phage CcrColossus]AFU88261.1 hypothetical protein CcrColossus_gp391 [Caulobacter phage CcrColossus]